MSTVQVLSLLLAVPVVFSIVYFIVTDSLLGGWGWLRERSAEDEGSKTPLPPVTFFRPLKAGVPDLFTKLMTLAEAMQADDQLLIGVEPGSVENETAERLRRTYLDLEIVVVACQPGEVPNPKMAKLLQMEPHAAHEHWILSDSEALTDKEFLPAFRCEWMECDVLTAVYRFRDSRTWPQRLDAAAVLLGLWPGLAVLRAVGRVRLTLGACTGFRRADLQAVGGWKTFAHDLAEDHRLGQALAAAGRTIRLSETVVTLECDPLSWRDYWRHQRRVAVTYRTSNPAGFAGAILTQGVTIGLLLACVRMTESWTWGLWLLALMVRYESARKTARALGYAIKFLLPVVFVASLVETMCWVLSWFTQRVWWSGKFRWISRRGRLLPNESA